MTCGRYQHHNDATFYYFLRKQDFPSATFPPWSNSDGTISITHHHVVISKIVCGGSSGKVANGHGGLPQEKVRTVENKTMTTRNRKCCSICCSIKRGLSIVLYIVMSLFIHSCKRWWMLLTDHSLFIVSYNLSWPFLSPTSNTINKQLFTHNNHQRFPKNNAPRKKKNPNK